MPASKPANCRAKGCSSAIIGMLKKGFGLPPTHCVKPKAFFLSLRQFSAQPNTGSKIACIFHAQNCLPNDCLAACFLPQFKWGLTTCQKSDYVGAGARKQSWGNTLDWHAYVGKRCLRNCCRPQIFMAPILSKIPWNYIVVDAAKKSFLLWNTQ